MPKLLHEKRIFPTVGGEAAKGIITVLERTIEEDDGRLRTQFVWDRVAPFVMTVPLCPGNILLKREFKYGAMREVLTFAAGAVKLSEEPEEAAARELREEFGLKAEKLVPLGTGRPLHNSPDKTTERQYLFLARETSVIPDFQREDGVIVSYPLEDLGALFRNPAMCIPLCRLALFETMRELGMISEFSRI